MKFLVQWSGSSSMVTSDSCLAAKAKANGATVTLLDSVTDVGNVGTCCRIVEPRTPDAGVIEPKVKDES